MNNGECCIFIISNDSTTDCLAYFQVQVVYYNYNRVCVSVKLQIAISKTAIY